MSGSHTYAPTDLVEFEGAPVPWVPDPGSPLAGRWRYVVEATLARGAFGSVHLARCLDTGTSPDAPPPRVAIKVLRNPQSRDPERLLKREVAALRAVVCDRVPRIHDWAVTDVCAFLVLDLLADGSLRLDPALDEDAAWRLLEDLLVAVDAAHRASVLHLDVKPSNVLLDGAGGYLLTDFGIAQGSFVSGGLESFGLGTYGYRAPEQRDARIDRFDARTDLWGVGSTVWASVTGIDLAAATADRFKVDTEGRGLPSVREFRPWTTPELDGVLADLLNVDPLRRPGSAAEVLTRVRAVRAGIPAPPSYGRPIEAAAASAIVLAVVDPLWAYALVDPEMMRRIMAFDDGDPLGRAGERAHHTWVLLQGAVSIRRDEREVFRESREGAILGEVATLTGQARTSDMVAVGAVIAVRFNGAEIERLIASHPAIAVRMVRALAERLARESAGGSPPRA